MVQPLFERPKINQEALFKCFGIFSGYSTNGYKCIMSTTLYGFDWEDIRVN